MKKCPLKGADSWKLIKKELLKRRIKDFSWKPENANILSKDFNFLTAQVPHGSYELFLEGQTRHWMIHRNCHSFDLAPVWIKIIEKKSSNIWRSSSEHFLFISRTSSSVMRLSPTTVMVTRNCLSGTDMMSCEVSAAWRGYGLLNFAVSTEYNTQVVTCALL